MPELDVDGAVFCFPDDWEASKFNEVRMPGDSAGISMSVTRPKLKRSM